jgi:hypothetical protein
MKGASWFTQNIASHFFKKPIDGAKTSLYCALVDFNQLKGGAYYDSCAETQSSANSNNVED